MKKKKRSAEVKKLLALSLVLAYVCVSTACSGNSGNSNPGGMAGNNASGESGSATGGTENSIGNLASGSTDTGNGNYNNSVTEGKDVANNGSSGSLLEDISDAIDNAIDHVTDGMDDLADDLMGNGTNTENTGAGGVSRIGRPIR